MSLPRLDFFALSHHAAKWPLPGKVLLGCALAGLVLVVGEAACLSPSRDRLKVLEVQEGGLRQQLAEKVGLVAALEQQTQQFQAMQQRFAGLLQALSQEAEVPRLLEDIARLGVANGLAVEGIVLLDEQAHALYIEQPVQMAVTGGYHDLATFLSALAGLSRIVTVHDLALRSDGPLLRLDLQARAYRRTSPGVRSVELGQGVEPRPHFVYDASSLRDPFQPPALQVHHTPGRPTQAPDFARPRGALEAIAIDQFEMVGTLSRGVQRFALLRAASAVHRLAVGDYLGPDHGRVTAIHDGHVELVELFPNEQGAWLERPRTLVLNVNS
ncbi:pilus assembly protein PilP [Pseudomonas extremaustralis]|uniref:pilus assembly protein PilP n=1 Tax=Pseudomonas extremaustralis TaxID=359110 RepID=UPI002862F117|nr:pilus assembly protein PilP [Pseudomonas extremaustralis]MDR6575269.1 type IV pilus assembly protein PilO [Pseudomonas extremaustralis]